MRHRVAWALLALLIASPAHAINIYGLYNHGDLDWRYVETEHFFVYYHSGKSSSEWTARQLAAIADGVYDNVTGQYNYRFDRKIHLVVRDVEEIANGWAIASQDWMTIWGTPLYTFTRGRSDWLRNVFHHEFAHVVSIKAANPLGEHLPGLYSGGLLEVNQSLGRFNGVQGDGPKADTPADVGIVFYIPGEIVPPWFAEGVAQYNATVAGYEAWDTHRDMLLRAATLEDNLLTLDEMNSFEGKVSIQFEMIYNQGFSFIQFLADKFGKDAEARLAKAQGRSWRLVFDSNFPRVFKRKRAQLYGEWKKGLQEKYGAVQAEIQKAHYAGEEVDFFAEPDRPPEQEKVPSERWFRFRKKGLLNRYVLTSPDGRYRAFLSTHGSDRWGTTLYIQKLDAATEEERKPKAVENGSADSLFGFSPDSKKIAFTQGLDDTTGQYNHLFVYDIEADEVSMVSGSRSLSPFREWSLGAPPFRSSEVDWSPDGQWLVYAENLDGQRNLRLVRPDGTNGMSLTQFQDGTQIGGPRWSPDGKRLVFYMYHKNQQDLWLLEMDTLKMRPLTYGKEDERDPVFTPDGKKVIFASDRTGIFNLYELDLASSRLTQLTNVVGGAFWPTVSPDGQSIYYSFYTSYGYRFYKLDRANAFNKPAGTVEVPPMTISRDDSTEAVPDLPPLEGKPYRFHARPFEVLPQLEYFNEQALIGIQGNVGDFLDRHGFSGMARVGLPDLDQLYGIGYSLSYLYPTLYADYRFFTSDRTGSFLGDKVDTDQSAHIGSGGAIFPLGGNNALTLGYDYQRFITEFAWNNEFYKPGSLDFRLYLFNLIFGNLDTAQDLINNCLPQGTLVSNPNQPYKPCFGTKDTPVINHAVSTTYDYHFKRNIVDGDINPRGGRDFSARYTFTITDISPFLSENLRLLKDFQVAHDGNLPNKRNVPTNDYSFNRVIFSYAEYLPSPIKLLGRDFEDLRHTFTFRLYAGFTDRPVTDLDRFYGGGRIPLFSEVLFNPLVTFYGYEDYSISGDAMVASNLEYRFPILRSINTQAGPFYFESLYGSVFFGIGNGFDLVDKYHVAFDKNNDGSFNGKDVVEEVGATIGFKSELFHRTPWFGFLRVAKGLSLAQQPGLESDPEDLGCAQVRRTEDGTGFVVKGFDTSSEECQAAITEEEAARFEDIAPVFSKTTNRVDVKEAPVRFYLGLGIPF